MGQAIVTISRSESTPVEFDLYDSFGKKIWSESKLILEEKSFIINNLAIGIYYLRVTNLNEIKIVPIMVLK